MNAVELILELHKHDGAEPLSRMPGLWRRDLGERWKFWINGHPDVQMGGERADVPVQPYDCYVEYNGWPAGSFSVTHGDGVLCAGEAANYETFCQALKDAIAQ